MKNREHVDTLLQALCVRLGAPRARIDPTGLAVLRAPEHSPPLEVILQVLDEAQVVSMAVPVGRMNQASRAKPVRFFQISL